MPVLSSSRSRNRGNVNQGPGGARLEGWDFIQEKVLSHDEDMIADYADDIDTLLVFAGLFSAVLTAFLVVSLVLLQPDNSQATVQILSVIALQNGAPQAMQPFLTETADSLPTSFVFKAPTNAATINTLWFTSLVLSLAAALFGILAKQWCREYLRWHSVIAAARENVLVRQVRFEAWERWQVGAFIAFIPAFLEIALVLFLVGLLIFVPTFSERSMTIVVSVVIGSVLLGVVVLTILPVFYRLCPFQTPTGWAFVRLSGPVRWTFWQLARWIAILFHRSLNRAHVDDIRTEPGRRWHSALWLRSMDNLSSLDKLTNWRAYGIRSVEDPQLCKPMPAALDIKQACDDIEANFDQAAVDAVQTFALLRALTWVRLGSNDDAVLAAIQEAVPTIRTTIPAADVLKKPHFLSAIHTICPTTTSMVLEMVRTYFYDGHEDSVVGDAPTDPSRIPHSPLLVAPNEVGRTPAMRAGGVVGTVSSSVRPPYPHPDPATAVSTALPHGSLSTERHDENSGEWLSREETRTEQPLPAPTQAPTNLDVIPQSTIRPSASSRPAGPHAGSPISEPEHAVDTADSTTMTDLHTASGRQSEYVAVTADEAHGVATMNLQDRPASEMGGTSAHAHKSGGDTYSVHTLTPSHAPEDVTPVKAREAVGVATLDDPSPSLPRAVTEQSTAASPRIQELETSGGQSDRLAVSIDDTDRDLEAGPRIPSPVDEDRRVV